MYTDIILKKSGNKLAKIFNNDIIFNKFTKSVNKINAYSREEQIEQFIKLYNDTVKIIYQSGYKYDSVMHKFINAHKNKIKIVWGDSLDLLKRLPSESVHHMVTSPPYYNAREYAQWDNLNDYLRDMKNIISECYRVMDNNRVYVLNVGDIFANDNLVSRSSWSKRRLPLSAYFVNIFEECGFRYIDDYIWDKGEVQSQRHKNASKPYPFYQYPANCYEHILIFHKNRLDRTPFPCPLCGCLTVSGNSQSALNIMSWECKNKDCFSRSKCNRGKRFSAKTNITQNSKTRKENVISADLIKKWRRDIIKINPVFKINNKGENILGHSAPFPNDIPEMSVRFFSFKGETVLDPFAGSFTVPITARKLGRIGIGVELRKDLFEESIIRNIEKYGMQYETVQV